MSGTPEDLAVALAAALAEALPAYADRIAARGFCLIDAAKLAELRITVSATTYAQTPDSRGADERETVLEIAVQQRASPADESTWALVVEVANQIAAMFAVEGALRDAELGDATFTRCDRNPVLRPDHLYELNVATAPLSLTYVHE